MGEAKRKQEQFRKQPRPCAYCAEPANSKDHVPPKAAFVKPFMPTATVTVPACIACNGKYGALDDPFQRFLGVRLGFSRHRLAAKFWKERALPNFLNNEKAVREVRNALWIPTRDQQGNIVYGPAYRVDAAMHRGMFERLTKAFFYHHFKRPMTPGVAMDVSWQKDDTAIIETFRDARFFRLGDAFYYGFMSLPEDPESGMWAFNFYDTHFAVVFTGLGATGPFEDHPP